MSLTDWIRGGRWVKRRLAALFMQPSGWLGPFTMTGNSFVFWVGEAPCVEVSMDRTNSVLDVSNGSQL